MKRSLALFLFVTTGTALHSQEAEAGFELRSTISAMGAFSNVPETPPRKGEPYVAGFRAVLYPNFKFSSRWSFSGAVQVNSRPYFFEEFNTQGNGVRADILQAHLSYNRFWKKNSLVVRLGQLSSAFGSYLLRYDDSVNPLVGMPQAYGYYYKAVTNRGLMGAQVDLTLDKLDLRAQFVNSSPMNRRSIFDSDQYGTWTGGVGYTIRQGFRVGASAYRGPYLHRQHRFFFPGEVAPNTLSASAYGVDVQFGHGPWMINGEWQRFLSPYKAIPDFIQKTGYIEVRRVLHPRWYVASRIGYLRANAYPGDDSYEFVAAYRPNRFQLLKVDYLALRNSRTADVSNTFAVQLVTSLEPISLAIH
jgi:hypothetical protein